MNYIINKLIVKFQKKKKITSVVITHSMKTVYNVVDRVLMLQCGTIKFDGTNELLICLNVSGILYNILGIYNLLIFIF